MAERKVLIQCMANSMVCINRPESKVKIIWAGKGDKKTISFDSLVEVLYNAGDRALFDAGYLYVVNKQDRIDLGFEDEEGEIEKQIILTDEQRAYYLTAAPISELKDLLPTLTETQLNLLISFAVDNKLATVGKSDLIKRFCGKDIIKLIEIKRLKEED